MDAEQTVTVWIDQLREGDEVAAQKLWERYFGQMVRLARGRLRGAKRGIADEEDVALSAFNSFCMGAQNGKFPHIVDRDSLWPLIVAIVANKSIDLMRRENRKKRGGSGSSDPANVNQHIESLSHIIASEPTPEFASEIGELFERLLDKLNAAEDDELVVIAIRRMLGDSSADIARDLNCVTRTVERKVTLIQRLWEQESE